MIAANRNIKVTAKEDWIFLKDVLLTTQAEDEEERQKNETYKLLASEQRAAVSQLYLDRNRPSFDNDVINIFNSLKFSCKALLV